VKFAKVVFAVAGTWGVVVLTPLYFLFDLTGRPYPPPASYPHFFYGFLSVSDDDWLRTLTINFLVGRAHTARKSQADPSRREGLNE